ncbi:uncharacterized protein LOC122663022 [Telopea speciosissima]|uniref:uncharacterized protein LOC122663022 n=1 Tax=Telopea speciosissima TaxID=54955 RepID=UPI001CC36E10|nr:uncharacterized protein LOC122663022 [Telopea speciosissima]
MDLHDRDFPKWFNEHILKLRQNRIEVPEHIKCLARGPNSEARSYMGYIIKGTRFHTKVHGINRKTQNSGVLITALTNSFSSQKDKHPIEGHVTYYGILKQVIELEYSGDLKVMLFKCEWAHPERGLEKDELWFTLVNFIHLKYSGENVNDEPFVLAAKVEQVFYVSDPRRSDWYIAVTTKIRDTYDLEGEKNDSPN